MSQYKTIFEEVHKEIIEKKSRFIANVKPVKSEEEALEFISSIKSKYWDATHNVYAYVIGVNTAQRYSDDGEPQGTAGIPTLQAIKNLELLDVVVVITRYFGGILLGTGGLVRAYGKSAKEGLLQAQIVNKKVCKKVLVPMDYTMLGRVQSEIIAQGFIIENIVYQENVIIEALIGENDLEKFKKSLIDIFCGEVNINIIGNRVVTLNEANKILEVE